uniref:Large ribosomal subunit protein bL20m n=1 Tax=Clastoptera arizonana TaxID=38151 RepID=A0A1B6C6W6_9HEMI
MVFLSLFKLARSRGPDEFWRKKRIFKMSAHFRGRKRNCYSLAVRYVERAMQFATKGRELKKLDMRELWTTRVTAGCEELGLTFPLLKDGLIKSDVLLNRKTLADLAIWEPRTFKALTQLAWTKAAEDNMKGIDKVREEPPDNVFTRGMLKK